MQLYKIDSLHINPEVVKRRLRGLDPHQVYKLVDRVESVIEPKAAFQSCFVDVKAAESIIIDGVHFRSRVLRDHLYGVGRVFPFVSTVGAAVDMLIERSGDVLERYILGEIAIIAMSETSRSFESYLCAQFGLEKISCITPGSFQDWPIEGQKDLFALLPDVETTIGVRLTNNHLMLPSRSLSGIYFPSDVSFFSCQLCPRQFCEYRKARYDEVKARNYGILE